MNNPNYDIADQFDFFTELLTEEKIVLSKTIILKSKNNNVYWMNGQSSVQHCSIDYKISLLVEKSKRDTKYGVKLQCKTFTPSPFFRFDSDGPAHRNDIPGVPLDKQSISTPHFNSFNKDGKSIAYKNEILKDETEVKAICRDINFGISLFCMECNTKLENGDFPYVVEDMPEFEFMEQIETNYDQINFE